MKRPCAAEHQRLELRLVAYESAPHRIIRLAHVAAALSEDVVAKIAELRDEKGILIVTVRVDLAKHEEAAIRRLWAGPIGHESADSVEFELESVEA